MREHDVQCLLMGGQACVLYGGAEFSRDTDLAVLASDENAERLLTAMKALNAEVIAVPPFNLEHLDFFLEEEEREERRQDQAYWQPLKQELERLRRR